MNKPNPTSLLDAVIHDLAEAARHDCHDLLTRAALLSLATIFYRRRYGLDKGCRRSHAHR